MSRLRLVGRLLLVPGVAVLISIGSPVPAQDGQSPETYLLRWQAETGSRCTYMLSTSGTRGESIAVRTENFTFEVTEDTDDYFHIVATGESVPDGAPLALRFQRSLFPDFPMTMNELGYTRIMPGQPFPLFWNIPLLPEGEVSIGSTWSDVLEDGRAFGGWTDIPEGSIPILSDPNVGAIPFSYESVLSSVASFRGEDCAVIETVFTVAIEDGARTFRPFLGLVEGDVGEMAGQGAPVGGVVENSRAHLAGFEPGDFIIEAEGQRIRGWGGLEEIQPHLVIELPVQFKVQRGEEVLDIEIAPEGIPLAWISATGGLRSTCFFSIGRGIPLKTDLVSEDLVFTLTDAEGTTEERAADLHIILEYLYGGT